MIFNIFDIIIFIAIAVILVILVRKMPEEEEDKTMAVDQGEKGRKASDAFSTGLKQGKKISHKLTGWFQKKKEQAAGLRLPGVKFDLPKFSHFSHLKEQLKGKNQAVHSDQSNVTENQSAAKAGGSDFQARLKEADQLLSANHAEQAEKIYLELARQYPRQPKVFNRLGAVYLKQKNYADARDSFLQALKLDASQASRYYNLAMAYWGMGAIEKARVALKKALELEPKKIKYQKALEKVENITP